jgi:hypothetical protein
MSIRRRANMPGPMKATAHPPRTSMPRAVTEIRSLARSHTRTALKLLVWDKVFGLGTTDPLAGFASVTSNLVVSFYFAKRGFENVARIIKR